MSADLAAVKRWANKAGTATDKRDDAIAAALAAGASSRAVADAAGLSHTAVLKIARRRSV